MLQPQRWDCGPKARKTRNSSNRRHWPDPTVDTICVWKTGLVGTTPPRAAPSTYGCFPAQWVSGLGISGWWLWHSLCEHRPHGSGGSRATRSRPRRGFDRRSQRGFNARPLFLLLLELPYLRSRRCAVRIDFPPTNVWTTFRR